MKLGRFIVETHCHAQRVAARMSQEDDPGDMDRMYEKIPMAVPAYEADEDDQVVVYDNSDRVVYDMDNYGVDMCVLLPGNGFNNEYNRRIMEKHPGRFVAAAKDVKTQKRALRGEEEWTIEAACEEIDEWLKEDGFRLIGESAPYDLSAVRAGEFSWPERRDQLREAFELAADHDVPISWHLGLNDNGDPTLAGELKREFPDVPLIYNHGGIREQGLAWNDRHVEMCCQVAASWDDVYLETGLYWADLFKKPYHDPNIGPEQMIWGGDWGASAPGIQNSRPGEDPSFHFGGDRSRGPPAHQPDYWGAAYRQLLKFALDQDVEQDKLNLILGGNIVRLLDIEMPHTRLFEDYLQTQ